MASLASKVIITNDKFNCLILASFALAQGAVVMP